MINGSNLKVGGYYRLVEAPGHSHAFIGLVFQIISIDNRAHVLAFNRKSYSMGSPQSDGWELYDEDFYEELSEEEVLIYKMA
jgi:hypothetical protein